MEVALTLLTQWPWVQILALPRFFICCLVCGQWRAQTHLVLMQGILQILLTAKA